MSDQNQEIQTVLVNAIRQMEPFWEESGAIALVRDLTHNVLYINDEFAKLIKVEPEQLTGSASGSAFPALLNEHLIEREKQVHTGGKPVVSEEKMAFENAVVTYSTVFFPLKNRAGDVLGAGLVGIPLKNGISFEADKTAVHKDDNADIDPLTEIPTHQAMADAIQQKITLSEKNGNPLSIVLINIDHLARINEKSGRTAGDIVLVEFCELVKNHLRSTDLFGRWDASDFILALPDTNVVAAGQIAERIRHAIENRQFGKTPSLTACFGVAIHERGESLPDCVSRADAAVFVAKVNGKNRVEVDRAGMSDLGLPDLKASNFLRLVWKREYECGNTIIDYQHRLMVSDANHLLAAMLENTPKKRITPLINNLLAHIQQHFDEEESILEKMGYSETREHAMIHRQLIAKAVRLSVRFEEHQLDFGEIFNFLANDIVIEHMLKTDKKYFPFLPQAQH